MLESACMKDEPNPTPQDSAQAPGAPVANMGMSQPVGQVNVHPPNMTPNMGQQGMHQTNMADMVPANMAQQGLAQANMTPQSMAQAGMVQQAQQAQQIVQMDMSNIDPSIGLQHMGGMAPMGNMGNMSAPGHAMNMQGGQLRSEKLEEMPQEM